MVMKPMSRRDFLKWLAAGAVAAGLSHFGVLNFGGVSPALADDCSSMADYCNPGEDIDICPDPQAGSSDVCIPPMEPDECLPAQDEPDVCDLTNVPPDNCNIPPGTPDQCEVPPGGPDTCAAPANVDVCPDAPGGDGDACSATLPSEPDECIPAVNEPDLCPGDAEPDFCRDPGTGQVAQDNCSPPPGDPDICWEGGQNVVDLCNPPGDQDAPPNAVRMTSFHTLSATTVLEGAAVVGAAVAALGAALATSDKS